MAFFRGLIRSSKSNGSSSLFNYGRNKSNGSFSSDLWHRRPSGCREFSRTAGADVTSFMYAVKNDFPGLLVSSAVGLFVGLGISKIIFLPYNVLLEDLEMHRKNERQLIEELRIQMAKLRADVEIAKAMMAGGVGAGGGDEDEACSKQAAFAS